MSNDSIDLGIFQAYAALLLCAVAPIYAGSYGSLRTPKTAKTKTGHRKLDTEEDSESEDELQETLTREDAKLFPLIASVALFGLFLVFKFMSKYWVNFILNLYFLVVGGLSVSRTFISATKRTLGQHRWKEEKKYKFSFSRKGKELLLIKMTVYHLVASVLAIGLTAANQYSRSWILDDIFALCLAYNAITLLRLDSYATSLILLAGLLIYDIFWVFASPRAIGSNVMVEVATSVEGPIKITWPKDLFNAAKSSHNMLGLGDIVVPGIFVAFCLRLDYHFAQAKSKALIPLPGASYPKPYFHSCLCAYIFGLILTITVMHIFRSAQPALLYLSPLCGVSVVACGWINGQVSEVWAFDDSDQQEQDHEFLEKELKAKQKREREKLLPPAPDADTQPRRLSHSSTNNNTTDRTDDVGDEALDSGVLSDDESGAADNEGEDEDGGAGIASRLRRRKQRQ